MLPTLTILSYIILRESKTPVIPLHHVSLIPGTPNYEKAKNHHKALI